VEEPAPPPPVAPPAPPPERPSASQRSSGQLRAYAVDGPVEAVGLQADSEFWHIFEDTKTLGRGHFAKVKQVSHLQTREEFAAKILDKTTADNDIEDLVREFQMLRSLRHPNIIRLYAAYETPKKLYLVTELASGGELMKRLGSDSSVYSEDEVRMHVRTILKAIQYMHHKNSVHRDLKPENVLLSDMSEGAQIKLVDLGLSRYFEERKLMRTICGTHKYLAPELVQCDRGQLQGYDKAIDMWGVGLLTFIMLYGFNPFAREVQRETHNAIVRATFTFPDGYNCSQEAQAFVGHLLLLKAQDRLTADEALAHRWLSPDAPPSPGALLSNERRPVKTLLSEFNAQRMIGKMIKGAHRRLSHDAGQPSAGKPA
jgi:calcium/calmodulin-dependent protein kinase I